MSLGPRADFECHACRTCWRDLSVNVPCCPHCGEGGDSWRRLFNEVQVSTRGHRIARFVDRPMSEQREAYEAVRAREQAFQRHVTEAAERAWERAGPEERQAQVELGIDRDSIRRQGLSVIPAAGNAPITGLRLLSRDPGARRDSAMYNWPVVEAMEVKPRPV
jgi:hypothetical protein